MRTLYLVLALTLFGCAAEMADEDSSEKTQELGQTESALAINGCYGYLSIKSVAPGVEYSPYSTGRVWSLTLAANGLCYYQSAGFDFLYSAQTYPGQCAQYDARTWYCSGAGVFSCPESASLSRPSGGSDNAFGPYTAFGRNYPSYGSEVRMPFTHSYFDTGNKRVACGYRTDNAVYRYSRQVF